MITIIPMAEGKAALAGHNRRPTQVGRYLGNASTGTMPPAVGEGASALKPISIWSKSCFVEWFLAPSMPRSSAAGRVRSKDRGRRGQACALARWRSRAPADFVRWTPHLGGGLVSAMSLPPHDLAPQALASISTATTRGRLAWAEASSGGAMIDRETAHFARNFPSLILRGNRRPPWGPVSSHGQASSILSLKSPREWLWWRFHPLPYPTCFRGALP